MQSTRSLHHQITESYRNMYLSALADYLVGYANITAVQIINNLHATYWMILPTELAANYNHMTETSDIVEPIEIIYNQIDEGGR
jgi:hypothetical protein